CEEDKKIFKQIAINIEKVKIKKDIKNLEIARGLGITPQAVSSVIKRLKTGEGIEISTLRRWAEVLKEDIAFFFTK
ncbi:MAG: hypothetical protein ACLSVP_00780, partial [Fusobacterium sp.]